MDGWTGITIFSKPGDGYKDERVEPDGGHHDPVARRGQPLGQVLVHDADAPGKEGAVNMSTHLLRATIPTDIQAA